MKTKIYLSLLIAFEPIKYNGSDSVNAPNGECQKPLCGLGELSSLEVLKVLCMKLAIALNTVDNADPTIPSALSALDLVLSKSGNMHDPTVHNTHRISIDNPTV